VDDLVSFVHCVFRFVQKASRGACVGACAGFKIKSFKFLKSVSFNFDS
jgi:hypothetical protein